MALTSPENFDSTYLRDQVMQTYGQVARQPEGEYHFHRGADYAHTYLGYNKDELAHVPADSSDRFAGVGNPILIGDNTPGVEPISEGETVLDHACGGGLDLLIAARRVGPSGKAIGVDMTRAMRDQAMLGAEKAGLSDVVDIREGVYEALPVDDKSVDVVISNGVVNLAPDKRIAFNEIMRVLKPGGRLFLADVIVQRELTLDARSNPDLWAACIGGALVESELTELATISGLKDGRVVQRFNCFMNTSAEQHVAKDLFVHGVNFYARKPL